MNKRTGLMLLFIAVTMAGTMHFAAAEPIDQNIDLLSGWNAVFLEVEPTDTDPAVVFASLGADLQSVWAWNANAGTVEFIQNPNLLIESGPQMLNYQPGNTIVTNLHAIHGNQAYLIKMNDPITGSTTLTVNGEPKVPHINWKPNSFNFVGFHLDAVFPPLFDDFFAPSSAHNGDFITGRSTPEIYVLDNATSSWVEVTNASDAMKKGEGFWIYTHGSSEFNGPASVQLERRDGLHYGDTLTTQDVVFKNNSQNDLQLISLSLSAGAPANLLYYWKLNTVNNNFEWAAFPPADRDIPPGESQRLTLGVKRAGLTSSDLLAANIDVADGAGTTFKIPLSVKGIDFSGLWVGQAVVNKVSQPGLDNPDTPEIEPESMDPLRTGSEFSFRIIVHLDDTGQAKLLSQVIQMWDEVAKTMVLFTDDALISNPKYSGATLRDGKPVGRRISAPAFHDFKQSLLTPVGAFGQQGVGGVLTTTLGLPVVDPTNPFIHRYHPDHLVPDENTPAVRQFNIARTIKISFSDKDADGNNIVGSRGLGWGSSDMGGIYEETITGLHKDDLYIKGTFLLHRVSTKGSLEQ